MTESSQLVYSQESSTKMRAERDIGQTDDRTWLALTVRLAPEVGLRSQPVVPSIRLIRDCERLGTIPVRQAVAAWSHNQHHKVSSEREPGKKSGKPLVCSLTGYRFQNFHHAGLMAAPIIPRIPAVKTSIAGKAKLVITSSMMPPIAAMIPPNRMGPI